MKKLKTTAIKHYINGMLTYNEYYSYMYKRRKIYCEKDWNGNGKRYLFGK